MNFCSPLRYPGGKNKLAKFIALICEKNNIHGHYVEPYAGGASVGLFLLFNGFVSRITINDIDLSIYAFWQSILKNTNEFCRLVTDTDITIENWKRYKDIQRNKNKASLLELGFSTFFLNRTNISGILDGGIIGGLKQNGRYKIDCRFNKEELLRRIKKIAEYKDCIAIRRLDALDLTREIQSESQDSQTIFYFDPPYFLKGSSLYTNYYNQSDHTEVSRAIRKIKDAGWIVSYDAVPVIEEMYKGFKYIKYPLLHTARNSRVGKEILFFSENLKVPTTLNPIHIN